jgi:pyruvate dehydrogenase E1 component alpha subunit
LSIAKDKLADMYEKMMLTRTFEETAAKLFTQGKVHGTAHFCIGEEASGIGVCAALQPQDQIYATHRGHGQSIGKGMDVKRMMAEFLGKATGVCRGKGGCMHIAELAVGNWGLTASWPAASPSPWARRSARRCRASTGWWWTSSGTGRPTRGAFMRR